MPFFSKIPFREGCRTYLALNLSFSRTYPIFTLCFYLSFVCAGVVSHWSLELEDDKPEKVVSWTHLIFTEHWQLAVVSRTVVPYGATRKCLFVSRAHVLHSMPKQTMLRWQQKCSKLMFQTCVVKACDHAAENLKDAHDWKTGQKSAGVRKNEAFLDDNNRSHLIHLEVQRMIDSAMFRYEQNTMGRLANGMIQNIVETSVQSAVKKMTTRVLSLIHGTV